MAQLSAGKVDNAIHWFHLYPVDNAIGDLHDDVFWLLRPEFFICANKGYWYLNLVGIIKYNFTGVQASGVIITYCDPADGAIQILNSWSQDTISRFTFTQMLLVDVFLSSNKHRRYHPFIRTLVKDKSLLTPGRLGCHRSTSFWLNWRATELSAWLLLAWCEPLS